MFSLILCRRFCQNGRESDQLASLDATAIESAPVAVICPRRIGPKGRWPARGRPSGNLRPGIRSGRGDLASEGSSVTARRCPPAAVSRA